MKRSEALNLRKHIENAVQSLPDTDALEAVVLHPVWNTGVDYSAGYKVQHNGKLWKCNEPGHTSQAGWEPSVNTSSLWAEICETHDGSRYDPIPYHGNMALENGKYYSQDGVVYLCSRDTVSPVYHSLRELVGIYVELEGE